MTIFLGMNRLGRPDSSGRSRRRRGAAALLLVSSLVTLTGFSIDTRRIRSSGYPFDFKINCLLGERQVLIFLIDGARADRLYEMARAGELPHIKKYIMERGVTVEHAVTSIPSITNASIAALTCGVYPGHLNVVGNRWFDRNELKRINLLSLGTYYGAHAYLARETIFEILRDEPTVTVSTPCRKGSTFNIHLHYNLAGMSNYIIGRWEKVDKVFIKEFQDVVEYANREGVFPRVTFFHLPGMDYTSHEHGPYSEEAGMILRNIDEVIGELVRGLERNGVLDRFCIVLVADHGQVPMKKENYFLWGDYLKREIGLPALIRYGEKDEYVTRTLGLATMTKFDEIDQKAKEGRERYYNKFAVIEANNGRNTFLYFRHNPEDRWIAPEEMAPWPVRPTWRELRNYHTPRGEVDLIEKIRMEKPVAFVAARPRTGEVAIFSRHGEGLIKTETVGDETRYAYQVVRGEDPLGYAQSSAAAGLMDGTYHSSRDWLKATYSLTQTDVVAQLPSLFESPCCGDLFIVPVEGWDFEKINVGGHGGFLPGEMHVPLVIAGPQIRKGRLCEPVRTVDLVPTLLDYLGFGDRKGGVRLDGISFWEEIKDR